MNRPTMLILTSVAAFLAAPAASMAASATLKSPEGKDVGTVDLTETPNGVLLRVELSGIAAGAHGFHVHEFGRCAPDFGAAGGHFMGNAMHHGYMADGGPHAGDMPNLEVPASGELTIEVFNPNISLHDGHGALFDDDGSAIVVHAGPDDYTSQPSGNSGDRIACGVIEE